MKFGFENPGNEKPKVTADYGKTEGMSVPTTEELDAMLEGFGRPIANSEQATELSESAERQIKIKKFVEGVSSLGADDSYTEYGKLIDTLRSSMNISDLVFLKELLKEIIVKKTAEGALGDHGPEKSIMTKLDSSINIISRTEEESKDADVKTEAAALRESL